MSFKIFNFTLPFGNIPKYDDYFTINDGDIKLYVIIFNNDSKFPKIVVANKYVYLNKQINKNSIISKLHKKEIEIGIGITHSQSSKTNWIGCLDLINKSFHHNVNYSGKINYRNLLKNVIE